MKKIFITFFLITNLLLFLNIYNLFCEKDVSDVYSIFGYNQSLNQNVVSFHKDLNNEDKMEFYSFLEQLVKEYNIEILKDDHDYTANRHKLYILTSKDLAKTMKLPTTEKVDFINEPDSFYTNDKNIRKGKYFFLLNPKLDVEIRPLQQFIKNNMIATGYTFYSENAEVFDSINDLIKERYGDYAIFDGPFEQHLLEIDSEFSSIVNQSLILSSIITLILLLFLLSASLKKISILKLNGYSNFQLVSHLFLKQFILLILLLSALFIILFLLTAGAINNRTVPFAKYLAKATLLEIPMLLLILSIAALILKGLSLPKLIKNQNFNLPLQYVNYLIKIGFFILFLPQIFLYYSEVKESLMVVNQLRSYGTVNNVLYISAFLEGYQFDGYDIAKVLMTKNYDDPIFMEYQKSYEYLNEKGAVHFDTNYISLGSKTDVDLFRVNMNYVKLHPIYKPNGDILNLDNQGSKVYILVPEDYMEESQISTEAFYTEENDVEVMAISKNQKIYNYNFVRSSSSSHKGVFMVYTDDAFRHDKSIFNGVYFRDITSEDLNSSLVSIDYRDKVVINNLEEDRLFLINHRIDYMSEYLFFLIIAVLISISISIEYAYLYYKGNRKRILVKKLSGHSFISIYSVLIIQVLLAYIIPLIWMYRGNVAINYWIIGLFIALDVLATFTFHKLLDKQYLSTLLKEI